MTDISPKDLALVGWALARTKIPSETSAYKKLKVCMLHLIETHKISQDVHE